MRQRDANLTALAAIGPRKKRKVDSPGPGSGSEVCIGSIATFSAGDWLYRKVASVYVVMVTAAFLRASPVFLIVPDSK